MINKLDDPKTDLKLPISIISYGFINQFSNNNVIRQSTHYNMADKFNIFSENLKPQNDHVESVEKNADVTDALNWSPQDKSVTSTPKRYKMNHLKRGRAIIFNHYRFKNYHLERKGTASDVKNLTKALLKLGFMAEEIIIHHDLSADNIANELKKVQQEDHTNRDLLMVFVLTHGSQNDKISAYDVEFPVENLWEPFRADKCKTLAGKPKIFCIIACRGDTVDYGHKLIKNDEVDAIPTNLLNSYTIPVWADFLYIFSTYKGYLSYRNIEAGTWYIQAFCEELFETNLSQTSFIEFLTAVNGRLSSSFETGNFFDRKKQIPTFSSTLTKSLYFASYKSTSL